MFDWHYPWEGLFIEPAWGIGSVRLNEQTENAGLLSDMQKAKNKNKKNGRGVKHQSSNNKQIA